MMLWRCRPFGPDTPASRRGWWQESPITRETTKETVKTIARGMPDVSGVTVVDLLGVLFSFAPEAAGATGARYSLRPLAGEAGRHIKLPRWRGENAKLVYRHCEEHSRRSNPFFLCVAIWIASLALAMTSSWLFENRILPDERTRNAAACSGCSLPPCGGERERGVVTGTAAAAHPPP